MLELLDVLLSFGEVLLESLVETFFDGEFFCFFCQLVKDFVVLAQLVSLFAELFEFFFVVWEGLECFDNLCALLFFLFEEFVFLFELDLQLFAVCLENIPRGLGMLDL